MKYKLFQIHVTEAEHNKINAEGHDSVEKHKMKLDMSFSKDEASIAKKAFEKAIYKDPDKYFTEDIMKQIDEACKKEFLYGTSVDDDTTTTLELESE